METFSTRDLVRATDASYRQVDHWTRLGLIEPFQPARGSGSVRRYDERELRIVATLAQLSELGAPLDPIGRHVASALRARDLDDPIWRSLLFVTVDGHLLSGPNGSGWLIDLGELALAAAAA